MDELVAARDADDQKSDADMNVALDAAIERIKARADEYKAGEAPTPPVVDMLVISGGGDWGAFGAGFLKGWGNVPAGEMSRPRFDVVTGVSTGALIAPFAFLGDDASIEKVMSFYRNPKKDWVKPRRLISFLRGGASYADIPGLGDIKNSLDPDTIHRIADQGKLGRILAVNTTNIDTAEARIFDVAKEARLAGPSGNSERIENILLASSAIPAVFPPREIDGFLYIDGGMTGNVLLGNPHVDTDRDGFVARWVQHYPKTPLPKIRYWIIFNNELRWPPEVLEQKWTSVFGKSLTTSTRAATLNSIRKLFLQAEYLHCKFGANIEVRFTAVPDGWIAPKPGVFTKETMNALADLGEKMGADPASWRTTPP